MSSLDDLISSLAKTVGENDPVQSVKNFIDTGYPPLNKTISGRFDGGLPYGRIVEMYGQSSSGKTALATQWMVQTQKLGGVAIFIDWERSFDVELAKSFGLNDERPFWIYLKPDTWEKGNILAANACKLIRESKAIPAEAPILIVFDSVASAIPQSMIEKEIDEYTMNDTTALARVASTTLKTMAHHAEHFNATFLYLNQVRTKPGVVYGDNTCLRGNVQIPFVDGTTATMKDIVENKIDKEVWGYDIETKTFKPSKIINWFNNGNAVEKGKKWIHIRTNLPDTRNGIGAITVTEDHYVYVDGCDYKRADQVSIKDKVLTKQKQIFNGKAREFLYGVIGFDCHIVTPHSTGALQFEDFNDPEYVKWKVDKLSSIVSFNKKCFTTKTGSYERYVSSFSSEIGKLKNIARKPHELYKSGMTPLQLAIAIMDDGTFVDGCYRISLRRYSGCDEILETFAEILYKSFGIRYNIVYGCGRIDIDRVDTEKVAKFISTFVPPCMSRKLPEEYRGRYVDFELPKEVKHIDVFAEVTEVRLGGTKASDTMYDIEVEGCHNFLAGNVHNGFLVHNCTTGGSAMEFYATVRMQLSRKKITETKDGGKTFVGQTINVKCTKSKLTKPFQECSLDMVYDDLGVARFDAVGSTINYMTDHGLLEKSGPRITWTDGKKYFTKELIRKVSDEGGLPLLEPMLK